MLELVGVTSDGAPSPSGEATLVHAVHPQPVLWSAALLPTVLDRFQKQDTSFKAVPLDKWVAALTDEERDAGASDDSSLSAFRLVPFLAGLAAKDAPARPQFETMQATKRSPTLRCLPAIGADSMKIWLDQWGL